MCITCSPATRARQRVRCRWRHGPTMFPSPQSQLWVKVGTTITTRFQGQHGTVFTRAKWIWVIASSKSWNSSDSRGTCSFRHGCRRAQALHPFGLALNRSLRPDRLLRRARAEVHLSECPQSVLLERQLLGPLLPLPMYELVAVVRRSSIPGVKLYYPTTTTGRTVRRGRPLARNANDRFNADGMGGARTSLSVPCRRCTAPGIAATSRFPRVEHCR